MTLVRSGRAVNAQRTVLAFGPVGRWHSGLGEYFSNPLPTPTALLSFRRAFRHFATLMLLPQCLALQFQGFFRRLGRSKLISLMVDHAHRIHACRGSRRVLRSGINVDNQLAALSIDPLFFKLCVHGLELQVFITQHYLRRVVGDACALGVKLLNRIPDGRFACRSPKDTDHRGPSGCWDARSCHSLKVEADPVSSSGHYSGVCQLFLWNPRQRPARNVGSVELVNALGVLGVDDLAAKGDLSPARNARRRLIDRGHHLLSGHACRRRPLNARRRAPHKHHRQQHVTHGHSVRLVGPARQAAPTFSPLPRRITRQVTINPQEAPCPC